MGAYGAPLALAVLSPSSGEAPALLAAQAVARDHGVNCDEAVVIAAGSNVLVHLRPAPVVARVMTGTALLHDDVEQWLAREVAVGNFAAERGDLVVPPTDLPPPGPHHRDGLWMTLWRFVAHDPDAPVPAPSELGRSLRELHAVLAGFPGDLAPLSGMSDWLGRLLADLRSTPGLTQQDIESLRVKLTALTPAVFASPLPRQAIHGDASLSNLLRADDRLVWNDLEDVCVGPVEWDLAGLVTSARNRGQDERFVDALLDAYDGPGLEELEPFLEAHAVYDVIWRSFEAQRRPRRSSRGGGRTCPPPT